MAVLHGEHMCCVSEQVMAVGITVKGMSTVQVGSLVPAESAELHVLDAVHTRMGASDNLAMGSSTFLEASPTLTALLTPVSMHHVPSFLTL